MTRVLMILALLAVVVPFGILVRTGVEGLGQRGLDFGSGVVIGLALCYGLWMWDNRARQRAKDGKRSFGD